MPDIFTSCHDIRYGILLWYNKVDMIIQWFYAVTQSIKAGSPYPFPSTNLFTTRDNPFDGCKSSHNGEHTQYLKMMKSRERCPRD